MQTVGAPVLTHPQQRQKATKLWMTRPFLYGLAAVMGTLLATGCNNQPASPEEQLALARAQLEAGQYQAAFNTLEQAVEIDPNEPSTLLSQAWLYFYIDRYNDAREHLARFLTQMEAQPKLYTAPVRAEVAYLEGMMYAKRGATKEAEAEFRKSIRLNNRNPGVYYELAKLLQAREKHQDALATLEEGANLMTPQQMSSRYHFALCSAYYRVDQLTSAISHCEQAEQLASTLEQKREIEDFSENLKLLAVGEAGPGGPPLGTELLPPAAVNNSGQPPDVDAMAMPATESTAAPQPAGTNGR